MYNIVDDSGVKVCKKFNVFHNLNQIFNRDWIASVCACTCDCECR